MYFIDKNVHFNLKIAHLIDNWSVYRIIYTKKLRDSLKFALNKSKRKLSGSVINDL